MKYAILFLLILSLFSCQEESGKINIPNDGAEFLLNELNDREFSGNFEDITVSLKSLNKHSADILIKKNNTDVIEKIVQEGGVIPIDYHGVAYIISLENIEHNLLAATGVKLKLIEKQKYKPTIKNQSANEKEQDEAIASLIEKAANTDVVFLKQGEEIRSGKFFRQLKRTYKKNDAIKTLNDFIQHIDDENKFEVQVDSSHILSLKNWLNAIK